MRVAAVTAAVVAVAIPAAGAAPPASGSHASSAGSVGQTPPFGGEDFNDQAIQIQQTTAQVGKAKVRFTIPDFYLRANLLTCFAGLDQQAYLGSATAQKICSQVAPIPVPAKYQNPSLSLVSAAAFGYVVTHHGRNKPNTYGAFPTFTVRSHVGPIPVSATVHLEQTVTNGHLDPITQQYANVLGIPNAGGLVYPGFPAAPALPDSVPSNRVLVFKNRVDATLRLRLSDVTVNGRAVDIGSNCGTTSPVRLSVREPLGLYDTFDPSTLKRGAPGYFQPGNGTEGQHPGSFDGNVNIPAFANCGSSGVDVSPLLTTVISGPTNPVEGYLPTSELLDFYCGSAIADSTCPATRTPSGDVTTKVTPNGVR